MKKIFTLFAMSLVVNGAMAYTPTSLTAARVNTAMHAATDEDIVVGEDNYSPNGDSFSWDVNLDFKTQRLTAVVDLTNCTDENENVLSIGTDIYNYFGAVANGGTVHCYYTPSTKELLMTYVSTNSTLGVYKYSKTLKNIEGEVTFDLSYQYGLRVNGEVALDGSPFVNLYTFNSFKMGSAEGNTRSHATYKQARVVKASFVSTSEDFSDKAKLLFKGAYSRFDNNNVKLVRTDFDKYDIELQGESAGLSTSEGKIATFVLKDVPSQYMENGNAYTRFSLAEGKAEGKAEVKDLGSYGEALGLKEGEEVSVTNIYGYIWNGAVYLECTLKIGDETLAYTFSPDAAVATTFTQPLTTTLSGETGEYESKTLTVNDYTDGFLDLALAGIQFSTTGTMDMGTLTLKEVPYTKDGSDYVFDASGLTATLENTPTAGIKNWTDVSVKGKISGEQIYLEIGGKAAGMDVSLVYGAPIAEAVEYTDKMTIENNGNTEELTDQKLYVRNDGDGNYVISLCNIDGQEKLSFKATGTTDESGKTTYEASEVATPMSGSTWSGYDAYISIMDAYSKDDKFYGLFYVDFGGYGASYPDYAYYVTFGEEITDGVTGATTSTTSVPVAIYNASGVHLNKLQKGLNIVRKSDGKIVKMMK